MIYQQSNSQITKDTLFNDLPLQMKQAVIELKNLSEFKLEKSVFPPLIDFSEFHIPESNRISEQFLTIVNNVEFLEKNPNVKFDVKSNYYKDVKDHNKFADIYAKNITNNKPIEELEKTINLIEDRHMKMTREFKK
ncbi:hypothetical protein HERIO_2563 [Hepatospora eriocheir]|uniref:Uncharacterized protein n=1 Tax=Hepatospora eriocheir TaxID=1081669 RepID=A0A1X0Q6G1_9MICR|nr:hypothetical protein HERIO_2563 [Hepatospora eriocheir]